MLFEIRGCRIMLLYVIIGILALIIIYVLVQYNSFIKLSNTVKEAFSTMDVYLKKRWDLIPNLVEVVKGYVKHESSVLEEVVKLRNLSYDKMSLADKIDTNQQLSSGLSKIMAVSESYPDLKASQNFSDLTNQLSKIEDEIANSRKYYNAVVRRLNTKIEMFPSNIVAKIFNFKLSKMFEASDNERDNVKVEL
jgi:LemA protein